MSISKWIKKSAKQTVILAIASFGFWNLALSGAGAQLGNIIVYMAGNNPVTLDVARQVVTNPVVSLVNGRTAIVAGSFNAQTADMVTRELQRRGLAAQQTYQNYQPIRQFSNTSPYVTLPSYLPTNISSIGNSSQYRYVTAIPTSAGGAGTLAQLQRLIPNAFITKSYRGDYIYAGGYTNRDAAESLRLFLRSQGLDARVLYF